MAESTLKLMKYPAEVVNAAWKATSSSATLTTLTNDAILSPGVWICIGNTPISDSEGFSYTLRSISGSTDIGNNHYYSIKDTSYTPIHLIFKVTATANVVLRTAQASTINYTYPERGGLKFVKISD